MINGTQTALNRSLTDTEYTTSAMDKGDVKNLGQQLMECPYMKRIYKSTSHNKSVMMSSFHSWQALIRTFPMINRMQMVLSSSLSDTKCKMSTTCKSGTTKLCKTSIWLWSVFIYIVAFMQWKTIYVASHHIIINLVLHRKIYNSVMRWGEVLYYAY